MTTPVKGAQYFGSPNLVVDLPQCGLCQCCVAERKVAIGLGLLEFELGDEAGSLQFTLPPQLAVQLPHVDFRTLQQHFLFGALQQ